MEIEYDGTSVEGNNRAIITKQDSLVIAKNEFQTRSQKKSDKWSLPLVTTDFRVSGAFSNPLSQ